MLALRYTAHPPAPVDHPLPAYRPPGVASLLGVPGGRALGIRGDEVVVVQPDGAIMPLGLPRPTRSPQFRFFRNDANRMLLSDELSLHEVDLANGTATLRVRSGLVLQSFAPIAGGFAISPISPWTGITLYGLGDPREPLADIQIERVATMADVGDGRALVIGLDEGDDDTDLRTLVVAIRAHRIIPLAGFRTPSRDIQLDGDRILLDGPDGWMELTGLDDAVATGEPIETYDQSTVPAGTEPQ